MPRKHEATKRLATKTRKPLGDVYRARDRKLNRDVALKVLPEPFALDADRLARFKREAQVLASLNHPNIAIIHGLEESYSSVLAPGHQYEPQC